MLSRMSDCTFISYAREDQDFVLALGDKLKERMVSVWLDQWNIAAGSDWNQAIDKALHECNRVLIILSPAAVESKQVLSELHIALDENKLIIPLLYKACTIPRILRMIQHIDFTRGDLDDKVALDQVVQVLCAFQAAFLQPKNGPPQSWANRQLVKRMGTLSAVLLLIGTSWYFLVLLGTSWYFLVLLGISGTLS
jgi:hypothetical protein